jgi:hypothetical protein
MVPKTGLPKFRASGIILLPGGLIPGIDINRRPPLFRSIIGRRKSAGDAGALLDLQEAVTDFSINVAGRAQDQQTLNIELFKHLAGNLGILGDTNSSLDRARLANDQIAYRYVALDYATHHQGIRYRDLPP